MIGLPWKLRLIKDRPLGVQGHRLYAFTEAGRKRKDQTCVVVCSCGTRLVVAPVEQFQPALDLAARNHILRGANLPDWMTAGALTDRLEP